MNADNGAAVAMSAATADEPREGSSLHYSLLWTPARSRRRFLDTLFLIGALATTLDDVQDSGVAQQKVHWWHEELERLTLGSPRHPRTTPCLGTPTASEGARARLLEILSTTANTRFEPTTSDAEHDARLVRDYRARLALLANALNTTLQPESNANLDAIFGPDTNVADAAAEAKGDAVWLDELARGLGLRDQLARLPARLHRGHPVFSDARYAHHGLTPSQLARHVRSAASAENVPVPTDATDSPASALAGIPIVTATGNRHAMIAALVDEAHAALQRALSDPIYRETFRQPTLTPLARLVALRTRELRLWQTTRPDLLRERTTPTPLMKFFIAWRHRHGAR